MAERILSEEMIDAFCEYLIQEEKSAATVEKYLRDVRAFHLFAGQQAMTKDRMMTYKKALMEKGYAPRSINSMLASLNSMLDFLGRSDCKVKSIKTQRQTYCAEEKELTKAEYLRLLEAAKEQPRLHLILETICSTGIRASELRFFTVEAVKRGKITVSCKKQDPDDPAATQAEKAAGLRKEKRHPFRNDLHHQKRKTHEPEQYLGADESPLRSGGGKSQQGFSA